MVAVKLNRDYRDYFRATISTWDVIQAKLQFKSNPTSWIHELKYVQAKCNAKKHEGKVTDYNNRYCVEFEDGTFRCGIYLYELKNIQEISLYNYCSFNPLNKEHVNLFKYVNQTLFMSRLARATAIQSQYK